MKQLLEVLSLSVAYLQKKGIVNPRRQAEDLLCDVFGMDRLKLYLEFERPLTEDEVSICRDRLLRRAQGEPLQYIHGQVEFYGCSLIVNPSVLIPRQETEILVDLIVKVLEKQELKGKCLWDICCGSGCIGIALKKRFPELQVTLSDISSKALHVARQNAEKNNTEIRFLEGDLLAPFFEEKTHYLVCNPPYISDAEYAATDKEVRLYEPKGALASGVTGIEFYERLAKELPRHLYPHSLAWFEIGFSQGEQVSRLFKDVFWKSKRAEKDWAGNDRFFFLENE